MQITKVECKSVLTRSNLPKVDYCINPYIGCQHGCIYCYARFMRRFTGHKSKWGHFLDVKINAPQILEKQMSKEPKLGTVLLGSVCDAYQPAEREFKVTRQILKVLLKHDFPVSVLTKSALVVRDIDLFKQFSQCEVGLSITNLDSEVSRMIEPIASLPSKRLQVLDKLHSQGIKTYAFIGPILPGLTDLEEIFFQLKGKVDYVMAESFNLRCGNRDDVLQVIEQVYPSLFEEYKQGFRRSYWAEVEKTLSHLSSKHHTPLKGFFIHGT